MENKTIAIIILIIYFSSIAVHEGIHIIQIFIDDRIQFEGFMFHPSADGYFMFGIEMHDVPAIGINATWTTTSTEEKQSYLNQVPHMETQAYAIQIIYIILLNIYLYIYNRQDDL